MSIFRRRAATASSGDGPAGPFRFVVDTAFSVTGRGLALTGTVEAGTVRVGDAARLALPGEGAPSHAVTVSRIDVRRRRRDTATAGEDAALYVSGLPASALPATVRDHDRVLTPDGLHGATLTPDA